MLSLRGYTQMGIKNLSSVLKTRQKFKKISISSLKGSVIGIDFSLFLYRFKYNQNNPIDCFLRQIQMFLKYNILPVFVLDGRAPLEKKFILDKRATKREKILDELKQLELLKEKIISSKTEFLEDKLNYIENEINNLNKKCVYFEKNLVLEILNFFSLCGIPVIKENYESDWILANLSKNNLIDYVLSEDSDLLTFGAKKVLRNFCIKDETANLYILDEILKNLEIDYSQFVDLSILCGCDYCNKIKGINCIQSYNLLKTYYSIETIVKNTDYKIDNYESAQEIFHKEFNPEFKEQLKNKIIKKNFQFSEIEDFLNFNSEKKYLIPIFLKSCKKFIHSLSERTNTLQNILKKLSN